MGHRRPFPLTSPRVVIVIHHSAANDATSTIETLKGERLHRNEGYNYIIDKQDDKVRAAQDAPDEEVSNGTFGHNNFSWNVCVDGNFETAHPDPDEIHALEQVIAAKAKAWGWRKVDALGAPGKLSRILGHGEVGRMVSRTRYVTACPGKHMIALLPAIRAKVASYLPD